MRNYKFRGKTVDTNEWVCGNLLSYDDEGLYLIEFKYDNMYLKKQVLNLSYYLLCYSDLSYQS